MTTTNKDKERSKQLEFMTAYPSRIESADIATWKKAVNNAKFGYRTDLYNLYNNLLADGILSDAIDKRVSSITNGELNFAIDGKVVEEVDELMESQEFEDLITEIILAKAWGLSVIVPSFSPKIQFESIPRKNIKIVGYERPLKDRKRYIVNREYNQTGYEYSDDEDILALGKDDDLGFIFKAAPYVLYKRNNFADWAQFAEIFGMPLIIGKYNSADIEARRQLADNLSNIGGNTRATVPKESDVEVHGNNNSGSNTLYKDLRAACNEEIIIAVSGETMTTLSGSSRSQSETHDKTKSAKIKSDRRYVERALNSWLVPLLVRRGYKVAGGKFSFPEDGENLSIKDKVDITLKLKDKGLEVDDDYLYELTGIPKPTKKQVKTNAQKEDNGAKAKHSPQQHKKKGRRSFFVNAPVQAGAKAPRLNRLVRWANRHLRSAVALSDDYKIDINNLVEDAIRDIYNNSDQLLNDSLFDISNKAYQHAIDIAIDEAAADFMQKNESFIAELRDNSAVWAAFKSHDQTKLMVDLLSDDDGNLRSFRDFRKDALKVSKEYNENWLQTEYNTAVRSARNATNFRKFLETEHLYPNLEYIESTAQHRRIDHLTYVGTILPIRHEWWNNNLPPNGWNCKCTVRQTRKAATDAPDDIDTPPVMQNNAGTSAKLINTEETRYYKDTEANLIGAIKSRALKLEDVRQRLREDEFKYTVKTFGSGGSVKYAIGSQNKNEERANIDTATRLAKFYGMKIALIPVKNVEGLSNVDAFSYNLYEFSDIKNATGKSIKNAIQNGISDGSKQGAYQVIISFKLNTTYTEVVSALRAALQQGRAKSVKHVIILNDDNTIWEFGKDKLEIIRESTIKS